MTSYVLGVDLGGTQIRACLWKVEAGMEQQAKKPTQARQGPSRVLKRIKLAVREVLAGLAPEDLLAIGIASPGPLDPQSGIILSPANLPGWDRVPLREIMVKEFHAPVYVNNDANLACLAEHRFGHGQGASDLVYLTISTGIGGGVVCGGQLLMGAHGLAAEPGHMIVDADGPRCGCGSIGCLEALSSGTAIARQAGEWIREGQDSLLASPTYSGKELTAQIVAEAALKGDALAQRLISRAAYYLGIGVLNLIHIFDPQMVILGGGVSKIGSPLFDPVQLWVREHALTPAQRETPILPAKLGDDVGLFGAVAWALDNAKA
jgi:glucokinase